MMSFGMDDYRKLENRVAKTKIPIILQALLLWVADDAIDSKEVFSSAALEIVNTSLKEIQKYQKTIKAYRDAIHELEWDEVTGGCVSNCGGDSIEGHEEDCPYILVLQKHKLIDV